MLPSNSNLLMSYKTKQTKKSQTSSLITKTQQITTTTHKYTLPLSEASLKLKTYSGKTCVLILLLQTMNSLGDEKLSTPESYSSELGLR